MLIENGDWNVKDLQEKSYELEEQSKVFINLKNNTQIDIKNRSFLNKIEIMEKKGSLKQTLEFEEEKLKQKLQILE